MKSFSQTLLNNFDIDADKRVSRLCRVCISVICIVILLNYFGVFVISEVIYPTLFIAIIILFVPTIIYDILHIHRKYLRTFVLSLIVLMSGLLYSILSYHVILMLVFPIVVSCLYCDKRSVYYTLIATSIIIVISHLAALQLKVVPDEPLVTLKGTIIYGILPRMLELIGISVICISVTTKLQKLIKDFADKNEELYEDQQTLISSLAELVEAQSYETGEHIRRVAAYTEIMCKALNMEEEDVWKVTVASMMHDVGKIVVPKDILNKPGKLTAEEFEQIKSHVEYGYNLLKNSPGEIMRLGAEIAQQHHERYDGTGYLYNLKGENINLYARCVAIADVYDALTSKRCYKVAWTPEEARKEIISQAGKQFDPVLTKLFDENFEKFIKVKEIYPDS